MNKTGKKEQQARRGVKKSRYYRHKHKLQRKSFKVGGKRNIFDCCE